MACRMRLWNPEWYSSAIERKELFKTDIHGKNYPYFEIFYSGTSSAAAAELGGAADSVLDGTTTPVKIIVVSAQANDTDASTGDARKVRLIGVTVASAQDYVNDLEDPVFSVEEVNLNGTTDVSTSRYYLRVMHAYVSDWGSGGADAKGDITIEYPADTDLLTIAATYNESNGSVIYGAEGHYGRWSYVKIGPADAAFNNT